MGARNDDISIKLAKAVKAGFFPDVFDTEVDTLEKEALGLFDSDTSLSFTYAKPRGTRFLPFGDSLTYLDTNHPLGGPFPSVLDGYTLGQSAKGMYAWANVYLGHALTLVGNAGIPGNTTEQMLARIDTDVLAYPSDIVAVLGGSNDNTLDWPASRSITALQSIVKKILETGRTVLLCTVPPRDTALETQVRKDHIHGLNKWIKDYARSTKGVILADLWEVMADPVTGGPFTGLTYDGTHQSERGAHKMGKAVADALASIPRSNIWPGSNIDTTNVMRNGMCIGTAGTLGGGVTGTVADQWQTSKDGAAGVVDAAIAKITRTDNVPGEMMELTLGATNTAGIFISGTILWGAGGLAVGDVIRCAVEIEYDNLANVSKFGAGVFTNTGSSLDLNGAYGTTIIGPITNKITLMTEKFTIPNGATYAQVRVQLTATAGKLRIGRCKVEKV